MTMIDTILNWLALKSKAYKALSVRVEWLDKALDDCREERIEMGRTIEAWREASVVSIVGSSDDD